MTRDPIDAQARGRLRLSTRVAAGFSIASNAAVIRCGARLESLRLEAMQETQWRAMSLYAKFLMRKEEEDAARS